MSCSRHQKSCLWTSSQQEAVEEPEEVAVVAVEVDVIVA